MTRDDTARALASFAAAYRQNVDALAAEVWAKQLRSIDGRDGAQATDMLIRHSRFFPTPSEFVVEAQAAARKRCVAEAEKRGITEGDSTPVDKAQAQRWIDACRAAIPNRTL